MSIKNGMEIKKVLAGKKGKALQVNHKGEIKKALSEVYSKAQLQQLLLDMNPNLELIKYPCSKSKLVSLKDKLIIVCKNITFMGQNNNEDEFRIQIPKDYKDIYEYCIENSMLMIICGCYHFKKNIVWTIFDTDDYMSHKSINNSAAWVYTWDIQEATKRGKYLRVDTRNNKVETMNNKLFYNRITSLIYSNMSDLGSDYENNIKNYIKEFFDSINKKWYGLSVYQEMIPTDFPHKTQSAWEGWYLEFLFSNYLKSHPTVDIMWWGKKGADFTDLDLKFPREENFYGDTKSDNESKDVQGNKKETIDTVIESGGRIWYITCEFIPEMDKDHDLVVTKYWNIERNKIDPKRNKPLDEYGNRMKYSVEITGLDIYQIDSVTYDHLIEYEVSPMGDTHRFKYKIGKSEKARFRIYHLDA